MLPPYTDLRSVQTCVDGDKLPIRYGAQDVSTQDSGAYTGEISAGMLAKLGCSYVVVGHSERREYHAESDDVVNAKAKKAIAAGMTPDRVRRRRARGPPGGPPRRAHARPAGRLAGRARRRRRSPRLVVAYEPVWAIGTGEVATPDDAQEVCAAIRARVAEVLGRRRGRPAVRVLYGGSVKAANVAGIMAQRRRRRLPRRWRQPRLRGVRRDLPVLRHAGSLTGRVPTVVFRVS